MSSRHASMLLLSFLLASCGDGASPDSGVDGGTMDAGAEPCEANADCDDGLFCSGAERCDPTAAAADSRGCLAGDAPCAGACDEDADACAGECSEPDGDEDGSLSIECEGNDCDDADPNRYPGNTEVCDVDDHDEDCDPMTFGFRDLDRDGSPDERCCNVADDGTRYCGSDCDDTLPGVSRLAPEVCDGVDNDCNGGIDEGVILTFYRDMDGDGFGDPDGETRTGCSPPGSFVLNSTDCDDGNAIVHPGAFDRCDPAELDENCDGTPNNPPGGCDCVGTVSRACASCPGPGGACVGLCTGSTQTCIDGTWSGCTVAPAAETCDGRDEDCDGMTDNGFPFVTYYRDLDGDGYGDPATSATRCDGPPPGPAAWVTNGADCYDDNDDAFPGQTRWFSNDRGDGSYDYNCDGGEQERATASGICQYNMSLGRCLTRVGYIGARPACGVEYAAIIGCTQSGTTCIESTGVGTQECR